MRHLRIWLLLGACTISANLLLGAATNWKALVCNLGLSPTFFGNQIFPIDLPQGQSPSVENPIVSITNPEFVVINPDATRAYVTAALPSPYPNIYALDLTTNPISIVGSSSLAAPPSALSLSPDGSKLYTIDVTGNVWLLNPSDLSVMGFIPQATFNVGSNVYVPREIVQSPNKPEAYISTGGNTNPVPPPPPQPSFLTPGDKVFVINTDTNTITNSFELSTGAQSYGLCVTPDGSELYVTDLPSNFLYCINLSTGTVQIIVGYALGVVTTAVSAASDGSAVYAVQSIPIQGNIFGFPSVLSKFHTKTHELIESIPLPPEMSGPGFVVLTPDGKTALISDLGTNTNGIYPLVIPGQYVAVVDLTTGTATALQLSTAPNSALLGLSITPDQAPTARFTSAVSGTTVTFDASASSSPIGGIATYAWDFGDGQTGTTANPTISHTYETIGPFTVTLTVTNTGGTSTTVTFTGREVKNHGGPSARTSQQVAPAPIAQFKGKVRKHHKKKKVSLHTRWSKDTMPHTRKYVFYARDSKITSVSSRHKRQKTLKLHPRHFPHKISKNYRHYLDRKYNIRVVDSSGHVSEPTFVHVVKE